MKITIDELLSSKLISGPLHYENIKKLPGVYRVGFAGFVKQVVIVMKSGFMLYINDHYMTSDKVEELISTEDKSDFWLTILEAPNEIELR